LLEKYFQQTAMSHRFQPRIHFTRRKRFAKCEKRRKIATFSHFRSPDEAKRNPGTMIRLFARPRITLRFIQATESERTEEKESGTPKDAVAPTSAPSGAATR
jgi:hypothetical protein